MNKPITLPPGCPALLTRKQVAAVLGASLRTLDELTSTGRFPAPDVRVGQRPRWTLQTIEAWIDRQAAERRHSH